MSGFQRILFPVDFSERCAQTAAYVAHLAGKFGSTLHLVYALEPVPAFYSAPLMLATTVAENEEITMRECRKELCSFCAGVFANLRVVREVVAGEAASVITRFASQNEIDVIVLPTHGRGLFRRLLLGSVTSKVLHDANCAVLTTAHAADLVPADTSIQTIVCAVDLSAGTVGTENVHLIQEASALAQAYGATVRLVHAIPALQPAPEFPIDPTLIEGLIEDSRERIKEWQADCDTHWDVYVEIGDVAQVVRQAAIAANAGLVTIGRGKLNQSLGRLRTHVSSIIRESPCPVLSLPEFSSLPEGMKNKLSIFRRRCPDR